MTAVLLSIHTLLYVLATGLAILAAVLLSRVPKGKRMVTKNAQSDLNFYTNSVLGLALSFLILFGLDFSFWAQVNTISWFPSFAYSTWRRYHLPYKINRWTLLAAAAVSGTILIGLWHDYFSMNG